MSFFTQTFISQFRVSSIVGVCCCLLFFGQNVCADEKAQEDRFQSAASAYSKGDYKKAIEEFELLAGNGLSVPLLYNLGNSYAQDAQIGKAILNYERALRLAPGDSDIRGNLELVRKDQGLFQEEQTLGQRFIALLGLNQWIAMATIASVLFIGIMLFPLSPGRIRSSRYGLALCCLCVSITACSGAIGQYQQWHDGVVVASDARLRVSPFESAASIGTIQEGRLLRPGKIHKKYVLVVDEAGRSGWLAADAFEAIANF
ncbi:MAG TPA: tetratricopeptide repeat protein [Desulfobacterales bacterium]|nr:tetratricopeptide repeat protein [Desulfobacterales bacterium]